jgi:RimJ/RimL family protein N-acetyltransferase
MGIKGKTVSLVALSLKQVGDLCRYSHEPSLWTWWIRKPPIDPATMRAEIEVALEHERRDIRTPFAIYHNETREHIGSTSLWHHDPVNRSVEIGSTWLAGR